MKQTELKGETDSNTSVIEDFSITHPKRTDYPGRKSIKRGLEPHRRLKRPNKQIRTFHPTAVEYAILSSAHGTFCRMNHMLDHKISLNLRRLKSCKVSFLTIQE